MFLAKSSNLSGEAVKKFFFLSYNRRENMKIGALSSKLKDVHAKIF